MYKAAVSSYMQALFMVEAVLHVLSSLGVNMKELVCRDVWEVGVELCRELETAFQSSHLSLHLCQWLTPYHLTFSSELDTVRGSGILRTVLVPSCLSESLSDVRDWNSCFTLALICISPLASCLDLSFAFELSDSYCCWVWRVLCMLEMASN